MKKLLLLCSFSLAFLASEAQTTSTRSKKQKKSKPNKEALMQARFDSLQAQRQVRIDSMITAQWQADSVRKINDSLANQKYEQERLARVQQRERETDSLNTEHNKTLSADHRKAAAIQNARDEINRSAKLNAYQGQQVNFINQLFFGKAQKIKDDPSIAEDQKKQQLAKLNDERISRLKTVIGKSKEKKFEKARKAHNNPNDTEVQWISEAEGLAKN